MTSIAKIAKGDDETYEVATGTVDGGLLVVPNGTVGASGLPTIKIAGDAAVNVLGATSTVAVAADTTNSDVDTTNGYGYPAFDTSVPDPTVTVYSAAVVKLTYTAAACSFGDAVCAAANGQVRKWVTGVDAAEAIVGRCFEPAGISAAGGVGLVKLSL